MGALGAPGDAAGLDHVPEQAQIDEVETYPADRCGSFVLDEGRLREIPLVKQFLPAIFV
jgi:hypothetical protein